MPKVTYQFCRKRFLIAFARLPRTEQDGVIHGLEAIRDSREEIDEGPLLEPESEKGGDPAP